MLDNSWKSEYTEPNLRTLMVLINVLELCDFTHFAML